MAFIDMLAKKLVAWTFNEEAMTAITQRESAMRAALGSFGSGVMGMLGLGASTGAASSINVGDTAMGYAEGTPYVPRNMFARLHEGEAVIPKAYNPAAGGSSGGGGITINVSAVDGESVRRLFMNNGSALVSAMRAQTRNFGGA
jgi:hypothetical protein